MYPACLLLQNTCLFWNQSSPQNIDKIRFTFETVVFSRWFFWFKIRRNCTAISSKEDFFFFNSKALSMYYILITVVCITYHSGLGMLLSFGDIGINIVLAFQRAVLLLGTSHMATVEWMSPEHSLQKERAVATVLGDLSADIVPQCHQPWEVTCFFSLSFSFCKTGLC